LISGNALGCYTHAYFTTLFAEVLIDASLQYSRQ
jgi:hypothetical protein